MAPEDTTSTATSSKQSRTSRESRKDKKVRKGSPKTVTSTVSMMPKLESNPEETTSTATSSLQSRTSRDNRKDRKVRKGSPKTVASTGNIRDTSTARVPSETTKRTWRDIRSSQEEEADDEDDTSLASEQPGAFPAGEIDLEAGYEISTPVGAETVGLPVAAAIDAELVEEGSRSQNVSDIVAELLRQQQLQQGSIQVPSPNDEAAQAVVIDQKRICGIPRIWVIV
jgi:hypothetical protein